jgi:putative membrane protein
MNRFTTLAVAALFAAAAAPQTGQAQQQGQQVQQQQGQQATAATGQQAAQQQGMIDENFIQAVGHSDQAEIQLGQLASEQAENAEVQQFAQRMVEDHTRSSQQLATIAQQLGVTPPQQPDPAHQLELMILQQKSGQEFDQAYVIGQIHAHQRAVELFRFASEGAQNEELRGFAAENLPTLQEHLQMALQLGQQVGLEMVRAD